MLISIAFMLMLECFGMGIMQEGVCSGLMGMILRDSSGTYALNS